MIQTKLSPPWILYVEELKALFGHDSDIIIQYDSAKYKVKLLVNDAAKAAALEYILNSVVDFGNIELSVTVVPANGEKLDIDPVIGMDEIFDTAFKNNPVYAYSKKITNPLSYNMTYIVFKNKVVQFFGDNLRDIHGNISTLYEDLAEHVFDEDLAVAYCTDIEEKVGMPLGEWP